MCALYTVFFLLLSALVEGVFLFKISKKKMVSFKSVFLALQCPETGHLCWCVYGFFLSWEMHFIWSVVPPPQCLETGRLSLCLSLCVHGFIFSWVMHSIWSVCLPPQRLGRENLAFCMAIVAPILASVRNFSAWANQATEKQMQAQKVLRVRKSMSRRPLPYDSQQSVDFTQAESVKV